MRQSVTDNKAEVFLPWNAEKNNFDNTCHPELEKLAELASQK